MSSRRQVRDEDVAQALRDQSAKPQVDAGTQAWLLLAANLIDRLQAGRVEASRVSADRQWFLRRYGWVD